METASTVLRLSLGLVLITAAASKAIADGSPTRMLAAIDHRLGAISPRWLVALTGAEFAVGIWLLSGVESAIALAAFLVTMIGFTAVLFVARARGYEGSCGCMGPLDSRVGPLSILRNLVLVSMAGIALLRPAPTDVSLAIIGVATLLAVVLVGVYAMLVAAERVLSAPEPGLRVITEDK